MKIYQSNKNFSQSPQTRINTGLLPPDNRYYVNQWAVACINTASVRVRSCARACSARARALGLAEWLLMTGGGGGVVAKRVELFYIRPPLAYVKIP